ncbi:MAG: hypothetical protein WD770_03150 [Actinomycetota bacterium]
MGQALSALLAVSSEDPPTIPETMQVGGLVTYSFHRVGVEVALPEFSVPIGLSPEIDGLPQTPSAVSLAATVSLALLLGSLLLVWLLYRAGKSLGVLAGGPGWVRGVAGAKVAIPYALMTGMGAVVLSLMPLSFDVPAIAGFTAGGAFEFTPAILPAFLWPLAIGLGAGFAGGVASAPASSWAVSRADGLLAGALRGGAAAVGLALLLAFVGTQVAALFYPDEGIPFNPAFFRDAFRGPALEGFASTTFLLFLAPNFGGLALAPAMGSSLVATVSGSAFGLQPSCDITLASLLNFPSGFDPGVVAGINQGAISGCPTGNFLGYGIAPIGYWAFLLVPLAATLLGGRIAARRASATTSMEGALAGALAGIAFAAVAATAMIVSGVKLVADASGGFQSEQTTVILGPHVTKTLLAAVLWGVAGGVVGGVLGASRRPAPAHAAGGSAAYGFGGAPG